MKLTLRIALGLVIIGLAAQAAFARTYRPSGGLSPQKRKWVGIALIASISIITVAIKGSCETH